MAKVAIVGCGAMGSVYAGLLAEAGREVYAITPWIDHVEAIQNTGLRVSGASGDRTVRLAGAFVTADMIGVCDLVIIATKAFDVVAASRDARPLIGTETVVQTIQNGLGSPEKVAQIIPEGQLVVG